MPGTFRAQEPLEALHACLLVILVLLCGAVLTNITCKDSAGFLCTPQAHLISPSQLKNGSASKMSNLFNGRVHPRHSNSFALTSPCSDHCSCVFLLAGIITSNSSTRQQLLLLLLLLPYWESAIHSWQSTRPSWLAQRSEYIEAG